MSETKYKFNSPPGSIGSVLTGWTYDYPSITESVGQIGSRIGRKIAITSISLCGTLCGGQSNTGVDDKINTVRIVGLNAVLNNEAVTAVLPLSGIGLSDPLWKESGVSQGIRKIWYTKVITMASPGPDSVGYMPAFRRIRMKHVFRRPLVIHFADDSANYPNVLPFICFLSDSTAMPNPGFTNGYIKYTYKDI